jgi:hypothetical protein
MPAIEDRERLRIADRCYEQLPVRTRIRLLHAPSIVERVPIVTAISWPAFAASGTAAARASPSRHHARVRARLEQLRADHIVELKRGSYRATCIALYSSFTRAEPPARTADV